MDMIDLILPPVFQSYFYACLSQLSIPNTCSSLTTRLLLSIYKIRLYYTVYVYPYDK